MIEQRQNKQFLKSLVYFKWLNIYFIYHSITVLYIGVNQKYVGMEGRNVTAVYMKSNPSRENAADQLVLFEEGSINKFRN